MYNAIHIETNIIGVPKKDFLSYTFLYRMRRTLKKINKSCELSFNAIIISNKYIRILKYFKENFIKYENTYRMESKTPFDEKKAMVIVKNEIEKHFNEETKYDAYETEKLCASMTRNIKNNIKDIGFER